MHCRAPEGHRIPQNTFAHGWSATIILADRKLAALFWRVMVKGTDRVEVGLARFEAKVMDTKQRSLRQLAKQPGQQLVPMPAPV